MNILKKISILLCSFFIFLEVLNAPITKAFDSPTHKFVTEKSYDNIKALGKDYENFYSNHLELMSEFSVKPDEDENGTTTAPYKDHFYNYATGRNYAGEKTSALTKLSRHYENAKKYYSKKRINDAIEEISRAAHFLQDLNTPVHTFYESIMDATLKLNMHTNFERKCNDIILLELNLPEIPKSFLEKYRFNTIESIGIEAANLSNDNLNAFYISNHISDVQACDNAIYNAIHSTTGLFFKFVHDCDKNLNNNLKED